MSENFKIAYDKTFGHEAGYANHISDRGGETWNGIARNYWKDWQGWKIIDEAKKQPNFPKNLKGNNDLKRMEMEFYYENFWKKISGDYLESRIASEVFDTAVNCGTVTARKMLQRALNLLNRNGHNYSDLTIDGIIGAKTINAIQRCDIRKLYLTLNVLQGMRYVEICERDPSQEVFFNGWLNRVGL
jgi:lysozyme family protein